MGRAEIITTIHSLNKHLFSSFLLGIKDVTLKLFPDDRHEILNELDKEAVDQYLLDWIEARM